jgi:transposase
MGKRIRIADHLRVEELEACYRRETDGRARTHWHILWLLAQGQTTEQVATVTGYTRQWIRMLVQRYNDQGPTAVQDGRHHNRGAARVLTPAQEAELDTALDGPSPDGGLWTGPKVAQWINERGSRPLSNYGGWLYLRRLPRRLRVPRPQHTQGDPVAQATFKKTARADPADSRGPSRPTDRDLGLR